jgi:hypothetical protein
MFGPHFYHEKTRKCVAAFGKLFNDIYVVRKNSSGGGISQIKVPLSYAPKSKYLDRIRENPDLDTDTKVAIKLPRMSFEITSIAYDTTRQLSKLNNIAGLTSSTNTRNKLFTGVPYVLSFQLNIYAKSQDDALQIVEQILPTFNPQYTLTMIPFVDDYPTFREDIPISIAGVGFTDDFEGEVGARRTIIYNLDFEMRVQYHGSIAEGQVIRQSNARIFELNTGSADSDVRLNTIVIDPNPLSVIGLADSDFGFTTTFIGSNDSGG